MTKSKPQHPKLLGKSSFTILPHYVSVTFNGMLILFPAVFSLSSMHLLVCLYLSVLSNMLSFCCSCLGCPINLAPLLPMSLFLCCSCCCPRFIFEEMWESVSESHLIDERRVYWGILFETTVLNLFVVPVKIMK